MAMIRVMKERWRRSLTQRRMEMKMAMKMTGRLTRLAMITRMRMRVGAGARG